MDKNINSRSGDPAKRAQARQQQPAQPGKKRDARTLFLQITVGIVVAAVIMSVLGATLLTVK